MLFNSPEYLLLFLPCTLAGFLLLRNGGWPRLTMGWLVLASLFFYAWWEPRSLVLLLASIFFNYICGLQLHRNRSRMLLVFGLVLNLCVLGIFKYAHFFMNTVEHFSGTSIGFPALILPLGISFFTFQKVAYLIDVYRGKVEKYSFIDFCLFVSFFPQLIAGPIVHHAQIVPQFRRVFQKDGGSLLWSNLAIGFTILVIGLFKKVMLADSLDAFASPVFRVAAEGFTPSAPEAWGALLAYTFQLYFDFSGYSDMAIGSARMFGILLPLNFSAPYRARSIADFWRRWHMTLSTFLRDYIYIFLGGNRKGELRTLCNLFLTMLIAGLWHGAGWTFVLWGALHGLLLVVHRIWTRMKHLFALRVPVRCIRTLALPITFFVIMVSWVFFRAADLHAAFVFLHGMFGAKGFGLPSVNDLIIPAMLWKRGLLWLGLSAAIIWGAPTTQDFLGMHAPAYDYSPPSHPRRFLHWSPTIPFAIMTAMMAMVAMSAVFLDQDHVFLYFQF